jgi:hypothetical protein
MLTSQRGRNEKMGCERLLLAARGDVCYVPVRSWSPFGSLQARTCLRVLRLSFALALGGGRFILDDAIVLMNEGTEVEGLRI